jgi:DNA-binding HxlR family transcriptional regulator
VTTRQEGTPTKPGHLGLPKDVCQAVGSILERVGDKWAILIVRMLGNGPLRFSQLRRDIGSISQKMLTSTLRNLERDGFVKRTVDARVIPARVEYELTPVGRDVMVPLNVLATWALANRAHVERARRAYDRRHPPAATDPSAGDP